MSANATGTPTTNFSIPKFNTASDAPNGKGVNEMMDALDAAMNALNPSHLVGYPSDVSKALLGNGSWAGIANAQVVAGAAIIRNKLARSITFVHNSTNQSVATVTNTLVTFDSEAFDDENLHSTVTNTSRITFPADGGFWLVGAVGTFADPGSGKNVNMRIQVNGATTLAGVSLPRDAIFGSTRMFLCVPYQASNGDYLEMYVEHDAGVNINLLGGSYLTGLFAIRL